MSAAIFPPYDFEPMGAAPTIEAQLVGYVLHDLAALDHVGDLKPYQFEDGTLKAIYQRLQACRRAGDTAVDPAVVAAELPDVVSPADLARIEMQAQDMTPGRVESLASRIISGWRDRDARRRLLEVAYSPGSADELREAARRQLERMDAAAPDRATGEAHPLARFVPLRKTPQAVKWVVPGVIEQGVVTIAGARGVGKTTALLPLALSVAGLHEPGYPLAPRPDRWRHVIYAVEQVEQAERILAGLVECSGMGITWEQVEERFHLVEAVRMNVDTVVQVAGTYREQFTRMVHGVEVLPLVVFDTQSASFEMENENDNAEGGRIMAALKQRFERLPVWIVGHVAKDAIGRSDVKTLTARGAGSFEADSIANLYLTTDEKTDQRFLSIGKRRAEPRFGDDLLIESGERIVTGFNEWGEAEEVHLRWGIVRPIDQSRAELREQAQEAAEKERRGDMRQAIMDAVQIAWQGGNPINKTGAKSAVRGFKKQDVGQEVEALLSEGWLYEVEVPSKERTNTKRSHFLVRLDTHEHEEFRRSGIVPETKKVIPQSWRKAEIPFVPEISA